MASLRNAAKSIQRTHRERSQPEYRQQLGPLEKKKDYKLRAADYQEKRDTLKSLHKKTEEKNPDEFYFHMINSRVKDGVHHEITKKSEDTSEQNKLMETQDLRYVRYKLDVERKKIERLKSSLHFLDSDLPKTSKHTIFLDSKKKIEKFNAAKHLKTHPALLGRAHNRPKLKDLKEKTVAHISDEGNREKRLKYAELLKRMQRERELTVVAEKLQLRKNIAETKDGKPIRIKPGGSRRAAEYKWNEERKK